MTTDQKHYIESVSGIMKRLITLMEFGVDVSYSFNQHKISISVINQRGLHHFTFSDNGSSDTKVIEALDSLIHNEEQKQYAVPKFKKVERIIKL